ncbi:MAG: response regulator [Desulforhopalus sp.]
MLSRPCFNKFILVVDDNDTNREIAIGLLNNFGCRADSVENGQEAVEKVKLNRYDLILMDCQMPIMDGFQATAIIRRMERDKDLPQRTPIYAITGNVQGQDQDKCLKGGMDGYIGKPFTQEDIRSLLENISGK